MDYNQSLQLIALHFDTEAESKVISDGCEKLNVKAVLCSHWTNGSGGTKELAEEVVKIAETSDTSKFTFAYEDDVSLEDKFEQLLKKYIEQMIL